ncbi:MULTISPECIES: CBS domain-containing protein [Methylococcus]|uniref:CBS domain-containing protein n=1 Tax=Methylococcus capsulatus TaxID=414 RepID=A0ABZ2F1U3_METCP|nr:MULTISPECIES: CBS domain-containing protein [Methylococcus]MDF9391421.1 CBS domain-containing protein [Methylococcus capsulatus]
MQIKRLKFPHWWRPEPLPTSLAEQCRPALAAGHLISGLIGILCARRMPDSWPAATAVVGLVIFAIQLARCLHPPAGASALMSVLGDAGIRAMPVVDGGRHVIGIVTLKHFFRHFRIDSLNAWLKSLLLPRLRSTSTKPAVVAQIMTTPAITTQQHVHIAELARLLSEHGIHQAAIVRERRKLVGLVTQTDLIATLYRSLLPRLAQPAMAVAL